MLNTFFKLMKELQGASVIITAAFAILCFLGMHLSPHIDDVDAHIANVSLYMTTGSVVGYVIWNILIEATA